MLDARPDEEAIFKAACQIGSRQARAEHVAQACGADPALLERMQLLLRLHDERATFLEAGAIRLEGTLGQPSLERPGVRIGPYKLMEQIGEGGMGLVFLAEQHEPVRRKVALKIIKPGMETRDIIAERFEAERQALALMDHPNIARVLDAGATASGRPYFVMELVKGVPITQLCDQRRLTPRERLKLFADVCQAVQHAHQKGIIHRDIKPTNVLVASHDGTPVVKVIDFGVAKAIGQQLTERTVYTAMTQMVGTPLYMSPEQAGMSSLDIDTRTDIYSLGVLLYELLTGTTPFDKERLKSAAYEEIRRIIREEEPQKPSTRLSELSQMHGAAPGSEGTKLLPGTSSLAAIAACRHTEPARLTKLMRGELDWIVMKALEKDRTRRYETASAFEADVRRYLADEPVQACPPSAAYRLRKFLRRNKTALTSAALIAAVLLAGTGVSAWQAIRANQERANAKAAEQKAQESERMAEYQRQQEEAVGAYLFSVWTNPDPNRDAHEIKMVEQLDRAVERLDAEFAGDAATRARLLEIMARSYLSLGLRAKAAPLCERGLAILQKSLGPDHPETRRSMHLLSVTYDGFGKHEEALKVREQDFALASARFGPDHPDTLTSMHFLANSYAAVGQHEKALKLREKLLALRRARLGADHPHTLESMNALAGSYYVLKRHEEALKLNEAVLALRKAALGPDHTDTLWTMHNLANSYYALGRRSDALKLREETLTRMKARHGAGHHHTLWAMTALANSYADANRQEEALKLREESLKLRKAKLGPHHPDTLDSMLQLAGHCSALGRYTDALRIHEEVLAIRKDRLGPEHADTLESMNQAAVCCFVLSRHAKALELNEQAAALRKATLGAEHSETLWSMHNLANSLFAVERQEEALRLREETLDLMKARLGLDHHHTLWAMLTLADSYVAAGRHADALQLREETWTRMKGAFGPDHPDTLWSMHNLALSYAVLGRHADAFRLREETLALRRAKLGPAHPHTLLSMHDLVETCFELGRHAKAAEIAEMFLTTRSADWSEGHWAAASMVRCASAVENDSELPESERRRLSESYMDRSRQVLHEALRRGAPSLPGSLEAELLPIVEARGSRPALQHMSLWGDAWSNHFQILCAAEKGGHVAFEIQAPKPGRYGLSGRFTRAPDYGMVEITLDEQPIGEPFDGYGATVAPSGEVQLGIFLLSEGRHQIRFRAVDKNDRSCDYFMGIDCLKLEPVE